MANWPINREVFIYVEGGCSSTPANFGVILSKKFGFKNFEFFKGMKFLSLKLWKFPSLERNPLEARQKLYKKRFIINILAINISVVIAIFRFFKR